jgi:3D (Asp-Asp-Asp) domain-containing protein
MRKKAVATVKRKGKSIMKKLFKRYGATVLFYGGIIAIFAVGFIVGMYGRSAPDAETAEFGAVVVSITETAPKAEQPETPAAEFHEITVTATAYCPCKKCCGKTDGITATGTKATAGRTIAVDPSVIPYGTEIIINNNTYIAEDCGGAVNGNDVDIFFNTHDEAINFGRQKLTAYIVN